MTTILTKLQKGDLRTTGAVDSVVKQVLGAPSLVEELLSGLTNAEAGVRMRAADALEKVAREDSTLIRDHAAHLLDIAENSTQKEVQWHMAQIISYLPLTHAHMLRARRLLERYFEESTSKIVQTFALQSLYDLAMRDDRLIPHVMVLLKKAEESNAFAVKTRARKLLEELKRPLY